MNREVQVVNFEDRSSEQGMHGSELVHIGEQKCRGDQSHHKGSVFLLDYLFGIFCVCLRLPRSRKNN